MRNILCILFLLLALPFAARAQKELHVGSILDGHHKRNPAVTEVEIVGERLREYQLTYYHSLTVADDAQLMGEVISAFLADGENAEDKEMTNVGGQLYTGIYRLKYDGYVNRFLFCKDMRRSSSEQRNAVILIYMEGSVSLKSLQRKFKK